MGFTGIDLSHTDEGNGEIRADAHRNVDTVYLARPFLIALAVWIYAKNAEIKNDNTQAPAPASVQQTTADECVCLEG